MWKERRKRKRRGLDAIKRGGRDKDGRNGGLPTWDGRKRERVTGENERRGKEEKMGLDGIKRRRKKGDKYDERGNGRERGG